MEWVVLLTRVERNKVYRRNKRKFRLFILIIIIIAFISIVHINSSYNELLDITEANQIFAIRKEKNTMGITLFGEQIEITNNYILQGKEFIQITQKQILYWINNIIKKIN